MTEETRPGFIANYKIVLPGPPRLGPARPSLPGRAGPQFKNSARARPGPTRIRPSPVDTSSTIDYIFGAPPNPLGHATPLPVGMPQVEIVPIIFAASLYCATS